MVCRALPGVANRAGVYHLVRVAELELLRRNRPPNKDLLAGQAVRELGRVAACPWPPPSDSPNWEGHPSHRARLDQPANSGYKPAPDVGTRTDLVRAVVRVSADPLNRLN